jgi:hypothetical protein
MLEQERWPCAWAGNPRAESLQVGKIERLHEEDISPVAKERHDLGRNRTKSGSAQPVPGELLSMSDSKIRTGAEKSCTGEGKIKTGNLRRNQIVTKIAQPRNSSLRSRESTKGKTGGTIEM